MIYTRKSYISHLKKEINKNIAWVIKPTEFNNLLVLNLMLDEVKASGVTISDIRELIISNLRKRAFRIANFYRYISVYEYISSRNLVYTYEFSITELSADTLIGETALVKNYPTWDYNSLYWD